MQLTIHLTTHTNMSYLSSGLPAYAANFEMLDGSQNIMPVSSAKPLTPEENDAKLRTKYGICDKHEMFTNMEISEIDALIDRASKYRGYLKDRDAYAKSYEMEKTRYQAQMDELARRAEEYKRINDLLNRTIDMPLISFDNPNLSPADIGRYGIITHRYILATNLFKRVPNNGSDRGYYDCVPSTNQIDIHDFKKPENDQEKLIYDELVKMYRGKTPIKLSKEYSAIHDAYIPVIQDPLNLLEVTSCDITGIGYGGIYVTAYINKNKLAK